MSGGGNGGDLVLVHTVPGLTAVFDALHGELGPDVPVRHVVRPALLTDAIEAGGLTDEIRARTCAALLEAGSGARLVLCTCSTVGPGADDAAAEAALPILRIDRPMAEAAVAAGARIAVAATLATTIGPTVDWLRTPRGVPERKSRSTPSSSRTPARGWWRATRRGTPGSSPTACTGPRRRPTPSCWPRPP